MCVCVRDREKERESVCASVFPLNGGTRVLPPPPPFPSLVFFDVVIRMSNLLCSHGKIITSPLVTS